MTSNRKRGPIGALSRRRPSPAMAVAIVALVFAMVGTAAATQALHRDGAQTSKKKAKSVRGPAGPAGANGANGADGTARAYGRVGGVGLFRSKNVTGVTNPNVGIFCIALAASIDPSTTGLVAELDYNGDSTDSTHLAHVEWDSVATDCPAGQYEVRTYNITGLTASVPQNQSFFFIVP